MPADNRDSYVRSAGEQGASPAVTALAVDSFKTIATDTTVTISTRMSAAGSLVELNQQAAAEAYMSIVTDTKVSDDYRMSAASSLVQFNPRAGAEAYAVIVADKKIYYRNRANAVNNLAKLDQSAAAGPSKRLAADKSLEVQHRITAASSLARSDPQAAAPILFSIAAEYGSSTSNSTGEEFTRRVEALRYLVPVDGRLAVQAIGIIALREPGPAWPAQVLQMTPGIPGLDLQAAATMLNSVAKASVDSSVRLTAANLLAQLLQPKN